MNRGYLMFQEYNDLLEKEERKVTSGYSNDERDTECYDYVHNGRDVVVCECTTDMCNSADSSLLPSNLVILRQTATLLAISWTLNKLLLASNVYL